MIVNAFGHDVITITVVDTLAIESCARLWNIFISRAVEYPYIRVCRKIDVFASIRPFQICSSKAVIRHSPLPLLTPSPSSPFLTHQTHHTNALVLLPPLCNESISSLPLISETSFPSLNLAISLPQSIIRLSTHTHTCLKSIRKVTPYYNHRFLSK